MQQRTPKAVRTLLVTALVAASAFAVVNSAQAQSTTTTTSPSTSSGLMMSDSPANYVGLGFGNSDISLDNSPNIFPNSGRGSATNIYFGSYAFSPNMGYEIGYTDFGRVDRAGGTTRAEGINLSLIGKFPVSSTVNLLGKIGTTYGMTDVSTAPSSGVASGGEKSFDFSYGVGAELVLGREWSAVFLYDEHYMDFAGNSNKRVNSATLGARYRF